MIVFDNLGSHKAEAGRAAIRAVGVSLIFLSPHSLDLNAQSPEDAFARLLQEACGLMVEDNGDTMKISS